LGIGGSGLGVGGSGLGAGDWGLGTGDWGLGAYTSNCKSLSEKLPSPSGRGAGGEGEQGSRAIEAIVSLPRNPHPNPLPEGEGTLVSAFSDSL